MVLSAELLSILLCLLLPLPRGLDDGAEIGRQPFVMSSMSFPACVSVLSNQLDLYRNDMVRAAQIGFRNADTVENARGDRWEILQLLTVAENLRNKTQWSMECWDTNSQLLEVLLRPFDILPEDENATETAEKETPQIVSIESRGQKQNQSRKSPNWVFFQKEKSGINLGRSSYTEEEGWRTEAKREDGAEYGGGIYSHWSQVLLHVAFDWSGAGAMARNSVHGPLLQHIKAVFPTPSGRKVLVPGCGTGRLAYMLSRSGFKVEASDYSVSAISAAYAILFRILPPLSYARKTSRVTSSKRPDADDDDMDVKLPEVEKKPIDAGAVAGASLPRHQRWSMYPYVVGGRAEWEDAVRYSPSALFEDIELGTAGVDESEAGGVPMGSILLRLAEFVDTYSGAQFKNIFDAVVTAFFIDSTQDIVAVIATIRHVLGPRGRWINIGPLHYHPHSKVALNLPELRAVIEGAGFEFRHERHLVEDWGQAPSLRSHNFTLIFFEVRALD